MFDNVLKGVLFIYLLILKVFDFYFKMHFDISKGINYFFLVKFIFLKIKMC
jgi:hypothetical protein